MNRAVRLLVVDDNEANRDVLSRRLALKGYAADVAAAGQEALDLLEAREYDLVLLDVEMPEMSGFDVLHRIRRSRGQADLPVIMVTARSEGDDIVRALNAGANDYVTKPIDFPVALARITTHLLLKSTVEDLRESDERYALAVRGANDGIWDWDVETGVVYWSPRWKAMLGYGDESPDVGSSVDDWLKRIHQDDAEGVRQALDAHLAGRDAYFESEHRLLHRNGTFRWVLCRGAAVRNADGVVMRMAGSLSDVTDAKVCDPMTGLPNRYLFGDVLERAIARLNRRREYSFAILVLGLHHFRSVTESLGPVTADRLRIAVARRVQSTLRSTDYLADSGFTLARLSDDEFTILVDDIRDASDVLRVAERLRSALAEPIDVDNQQLFTLGAIGIAVSTPAYERGEDLLRDAAAALHRAEVDGTGVEVFNPGMRDRAIARLRLETDLRRAIESDVFLVHYQPMVSMADGSIAGFESLIRWRHPSRGVLPPAEFMHVAEETGMIIEVGRFALEASCRQMIEWQRTFGAAAPASIAVNLSTRQFVDLDLATDVETILNSTGLDPSRLKLEITESAFMADVPAAEAILRRLSGIGVRWSIDDFGTGYSSLSILQQLRVDTLKIDQSFVGRLSDGGRGSEMVRAIVSLAHNLGMDVVAEGVETEAQFEALRAFGCEYVQGFFLSKPVDSRAAERLIATRPWGRRQLLAAAR